MLRSFSCNYQFSNIRRPTYGTETQAYNYGLKTSIFVETFVS